MKDLVSVIIPIYNAEDYLERTIESILSQSYHNLEIILIDDGSQDCSLEICKKYAKVDKRIKVIHKDNTGIGDTRNCGLKAAMGEYIYFIDADDYVSQGAIECLWSILKRDDADTVIGGYTRVDASGTIKDYCRYEQCYYDNSEVRKKCLARVIGSDISVHDSLKPVVWNSLYSNSIIQRYDIIFSDEKKLIAEDLFFNIHYLCNAERVSISDDVNYYYRENDTSFTALNYRADLLEKSIDMNIYEEKLFKEMKIYNHFKYRLMRQFFVRLKVCLKQENSKISGKKFKSALQAMRNILKTEYVKEQIANYPIMKTGFKQRLFLILCKYNCACLLYLLLIKF